MNFSLIFKSIGFLLLMLGVAMLIPFVVALGFGDGGLFEFAASAVACMLSGASMFFYFRDAKGYLSNRGALLLVGAAWILITLIGAVPLYLSGYFLSPIDAWFESASGFTTTGATVLSDVEALSHAVLMWRSITQFLGGMGIIVLSLAVLPLIGVGGMELYKAEAPGPKSDKIGPRVKETARALWMVYLAFILVELILLWLLGMPLFDAVNHALTTMATGGFSTKNASIAAFNSWKIDLVVTFFMCLAGMNFLLHYRLFLRRELSVLRDRELRFYLQLLLAATLLLALSLWGAEYNFFSESLRYSVFQVASLISSTGFGTADFAKWAPFPQLLLLVLMVVGGCAGSTAGGIKCIRAMMLIKQGTRELLLMVHPKAVSPLKLGGTTVPLNIASAIFGYFFLYMLMLSITSLCITACGVDMITSVSGTISALSNIGPGLAEVGPLANYGQLPALAKILLSFCMIIGRLEIFTILVLFTPEFWKG